MFHECVWHMICLYQRIILPWVLNSECAKFGRGISRTQYLAILGVLTVTASEHATRSLSSDLPPVMPGTSQDGRLHQEKLPSYMQCARYRVCADLDIVRKAWGFGPLEDKSPLPVLVTTRLHFQICRSIAVASPRVQITQVERAKGGETQRSKQFWDKAKISRVVWWTDTNS